ncbi:MAG: HAD family hydrolase [Mangrovicoccus sp.]|nr:HAD family hydrolase [Mangrovicoccus sp.]
MIDIAAILFDKDGTLFDYHKTWANWSRQFLLELADGDVPQARLLGAAVGFEFDFNAFQSESVLLQGAPKAIAEALLPLLPGASATGIATRMSALTATVSHAEATPLVPLFDELRSRQLTLGVVTNDTLAPTRSHLRDAGIDRAVHHIFAADSGYAPKPSPDMLVAFAEAAGIEPRRVVMVGDSPSDMAAGRACGMTCVAVLTGLSTRAQLEPVACAVLPSIAALPKWLDHSARARNAA